MVEVWDGTPGANGYCYFRETVEDLKRRAVLGRGVDCQVEESVKTSKARSPAEKYLNSGARAQACLLLAG